MARRAGLLLMLVAVIAPALSAQQAPARDRAGASPSAARGTASISGVVVTVGDTPQPLRYVTVLVTQGQLAIPRAVVADTTYPTGWACIDSTTPAPGAAALGEMSKNACALKRSSINVLCSPSQTSRACIAASRA